MSKVSNIRISFIDRPELISESLVEEIKQFGTVTIYDDRPSKEDLIYRLNDCDIAIVESVPIDAAVFKNINAPKNVIVTNTGYEFIDIEAAKNNGIKVFNIPDYATASVAEYIFTVFLNVARGIWRNLQNASEPFELKNKKLGILGMGSIGSAVAKIGKAFGMEILFYDGKNSIHSKEYSTPEVIFTECDFLAVCIPSVLNNNRFISEDLLARIRQPIICVCIANNSVFDLVSLKKAIDQGQFLYLSLEEPLDNFDNENKVAKINHFEAWRTSEAISKNLELLLETIKSCFAGSNNPVNP